MCCLLIVGFHNTKGNGEYTEMNKRSKIVRTLLVASALMSASAFSAFAAQNGWAYEGTDWYYYDNGDKVYNSWESNDAKTFKFYLGDEGKMLTNTIVDDGSGRLYYVNEDGAQVKNEWRYTHEDGEEPRWYYFGSDGRAYESGWKTINGYKYHFTNSKMDYGWLDEDGQMLDEEWDDDTAWESAKYYVGDENQGWRFENKWIELDSFDSDKYPDNDTIWVFMGADGAKQVDKQKLINGVTYRFDENGAMLNDWYIDNVASDSNAKYYDEDGQRISGEWFQAVPSEEMNSEDHEDDTLRWFYANSSGNVIKNTLKKISGKYYLFDENGIMQTGFVIVDDNDHIVEKLGDAEDGYPSSDEIKDSTGKLMFFNENGAAATSRISIELEDDTYTMRFSSRGVAEHGVDDNYLYDHGILLKADNSEEKYSVETVDGKEYLVNTSGKVVKSGEYKDTKADLKYKVEGNNTDGYTITVENLD